MSSKKIKESVANLAAQLIMERVLKIIYLPRKKLLNH
jgi:hypothetical protein